ncbi:MAG: T9SS type A sorting domain-containing protein [Bacteroidia bacterium]|nr:T9SS type A sorting domain-containing protein [Bacteroidia bacterium]
MNWHLMTGTFVATGIEKHLIIGNFKSDSNTNTVVVNAANLPNIAEDIYIDHVSCIPLDLPAFAGEDKHIIPGETLYIGRQRDLGIDEDCMWYKLPVTITPTTPAIDTAAGIFVNPVVTTTYVVKQDICGVIKYDTVVVFKDGVGFEKLEMLNEGLRIYPQPASEQITLSVENDKLYEGIKHLELYNNLGQLIREEEISFKDKKFNLSVSELTVGVYTIKLQSGSTGVICRRIVIRR